MLVQGGVWDQPPLWVHFEQADYVFRCYQLRDRLNDMVKFSKDHEDEFLTTVACDRLAGLD